MLSIEERPEQNIQRARQEERQRQAQEARNKKREAAIIRDRQLIIGQLATQHFPELLQLHPYRTHAEIQQEFASFIKFLKELSADKKYISQLKEKCFCGVEE